MDSNDEIASIVWIGIWLARPGVVDFCEDQDRAVSATKVVCEGTSASIVGKS